MPRLAAERRTHLTPAEITAEALRQFDAGPGEPSIRSLAAALHVAPTAIYHHFPSQAAIFQAAVQLVWAEASVETLRIVPHPFTSDPVDVLVATGLGTRRAWLKHHRLSRHMAANPEATQFMSDALGLLAVVFEGLGLHGDDAAAAFHAYATFMVGAVLFAAANRTANQQVLAEGRAVRFRTTASPRASARSTAETRDALDAVSELAVVDPARDEELFVEGLRRLIASLTADYESGATTTMRLQGHPRPRRKRD